MGNCTCSRYAEKHDRKCPALQTVRDEMTLLEHLQENDGVFRYTIILEKKDDWRPANRNFTVAKTRFSNYSFNPFNP